MEKPITRKQLLEAPKKPRNERRLYDTIYLVPSGKKHDSGYMIIAVVGATETKQDSDNSEWAYEIAAWPDDINWYIPETDTMKRMGYLSSIRTDCEFPSGIMRVWGRGKFEVGHSLSSTDIRFIPEEKP